MFPAAAEMKRNDKITELLQERQEKDVRELNKVSHTALVLFLTVAVTAD